MPTRAILLLVTVLALPSPTLAAEAESGWEGSVDFGYLASSGNSDTSSLNVAVNAAYSADPWKHSVGASVVRATDSGATTAERYQVDYKADRALNEHDYLFGALAYEQDRFAGLDRRTSETLGYGRRLLNSEAHKLDLEAGLGATQLDRDDGTREREFITRLAGDYRWRISESASFRQTLEVERGSSNTYLESVTSLRSAINSALSLKLSYTIKRNSEVPVGRVNTDSYTSIALSYSF